MHGDIHKLRMYVPGLAALNGLTCFVDSHASVFCSLRCANADSHVHILDEPPVFFMMHVFFGKCASNVSTTVSEQSNI